MSRVTPVVMSMTACYVYNYKYLFKLAVPEELKTVVYRNSFQMSSLLFSIDSIFLLMFSDFAFPY